MFMLSCVIKNLQGFSIKLTKKNTSVNQYLNHSTQHLGQLQMVGRL